MATTDELQQQLEAVQQAWEQITVAPPEPRSTMNVIEYSLDAQRKREIYVNRFLTYFLRPGEPHGLGEDFLRMFLDGLPDVPVDEWPFDEETYDLQNVRIRNELPMHETAADIGRVESTGRADIVIDVPNDWFLLIELKFGAEETGTEFYYRADRLGNREMSMYESGQYYLFLHDRRRLQASEPNFQNWTWAEFGDVAAEWLTENHSRYPHRTVVQLRELLEDIQTFTKMTDQQTAEQDKVELYLEHAEAIEDVSSTFDAQWDRFTDEWANRLADSLGAEDQFTSYVTDLPEDVVRYLEAHDISTDVYSSVDIQDRECWIFRALHSDWGMLFKDGWWVDEENYEPKYDRKPGSDDLRIGFHHRMGANSNRSLAIQEKTLAFYFRNMGANPKGFKDEFAETFYDARSNVENHLPEIADITGNKENMIVARYDIRPDDHDDFFEAYIGACDARSMTSSSTMRSW